MSYCIYLRKSRADFEAEAHGEGETLARHRAALLELAEKRELPIEQIYEEIVSGETIAARPVMQKLLADVRESRWEGVLVMEIERLARGDTIDQGIVAQTFKYSDTLIITPMKTYDPNNEFDEEYFEFGLFMSRREYKTIRRRLQRGREAAAKEGKCLSQAPYGYVRKKIENDKGYTLEIDAEKAKVVKMIFDWYTEGTEINGEVKRLGIQAIARRLNEIGIPAHRHEYWSKETIRNIIDNPTYAGLIRWGYRKQKKQMSPDGVIIRRPVTSDECIIAEGLHEAIVPREEFDKAQQQLAEIPLAPVGYKSSVKNPLAGLLVCKKCGKKMVKRIGYNGKPDYIVCHDRWCKQVSTPYPLVEERVLQILRQWSEEYAVSSETIKMHEKDNAEILEASIKTTEKELEKLRQQLSKARDLVEQEVYTPQEYTERAKELRGKIADLNERREDLTNQLNEERARKKAKIEFAPKVANLVKVYKDLESPAEKNKLLKEVLEKIEYNKELSGQYKRSDVASFELTAYPLLPKPDSK